MTSLARDLRLALRMLGREPRFALFIVLIAGLGIGASTTVFSVIDALVLRPLPFDQPESLVWIANHDSEGLSGQTTQVDHLLDLRARTQTMSDVAGYFAFYGVGDEVLTTNGEPERLSAVPVTENFFRVLGVRPERGRTFTDEEARWNGPKAVVLSHALWARRFNADPGIIGRPLVLNGESYTAVGVLPPSFDFASVFAPGGHFDLFLPFPLSPETNRWGNTMAMVGRLKPGVSPAAAQADVHAIALQLAREHPERNTFEGRVTTLGDHVEGRMRLALRVLAAAVAAVMLIVCANVTNLLLARSMTRRREMAIRAALGAGRRRLAAQLLTEGVVLSGAGAAVGVALALAGTAAVAHLHAVNVPLLGGVRLDGRALAFTVLLALASGILFSLAPALAVSGTAPHTALTDAARGSTSGHGAWVGRALVVAEIAFACVLLVGVGLLIRSFVRVLDVDPGFRPAGAITVRVDPADASTHAEDQQRSYVAEVLRRVREIPGVTSAGITDALPLGRNRTWGAQAKGVVYPKGSTPIAFVRISTDGYLPAMGIRLVAGRDFSLDDTASSRPVMIVNETMARHLWPGRDPIGQVVLGDCAHERTVVGVAADVRHLALEQASGNEMYIPYAQCSDLESADLVVRSRLTDAEVARAVRTALTPIDPTIGANEVRTIQTLIDRSVSPRRFVVLLLGGFAAFALLLAALGIYALVSYSVTQRTQEIGIRMALGATSRTVEGTVVTETVRLAAAGIAGGVAVSWIALRAMSRLLYGVAATDPATFASTVLVLALAALVAGYLPARRAARIDPMAALRT